MSTKKKSPYPPWLGKALAIAQHQDDIASWSKWKRLAHRWFFSKRCSCCVASKAQAEENRQALKRLRLE